MTENWADQSIEERSEALTSFVVPRTITVNDTTRGRFTVSGLKRVPQKYFPTLVIAAGVVLVGTVMLVANMLAK
jgi:hypothetical protein